MARRRRLLLKGVLCSLSTAWRVPGGRPVGVSALTNWLRGRLKLAPSRRVSGKRDKHLMSRTTGGHLAAGFVLGCGQMSWMVDGVWRRRLGLVWLVGWLVGELVTC